MPDFAFYHTEYRGTSLPETEFPRLIQRAGETLSRYKRLYTVTAPTETSEAMALCAMAETLWYFENVLSGSAGAVSSASIGSVSFSYAGAQSVDPSPKAQAAELYRAAGQYLDIYRGCRR